VVYMIPLKSMIVDALATTFDSQYPEEDFRGIEISVEYPVDSQSYPGIWVGYEDATPVRKAGVSHVEYEVDEHGNFIPHTRWRFEGYASLTVVALTSRERDRLYDEVVRVVAFGDQEVATQRFRQYIDSNDLIATTFNLDEIEPKGEAASLGTPWGTDEMIYERGLNLQLNGEFTVDGHTGALVPLSAIIVQADPVGTEGTADWH
jgi:hypothetical protein